MSKAVTQCLRRCAAVAYGGPVAAEATPITFKSFLAHRLQHGFSLCYS